MFSISAEHNSATPKTDNASGMCERNGSTMKVILQQDVKGQGKRGELKEVSDGYARNYLLPRKLAIIATADNLNTMKLQDAAKKAQIEKEKAAARETAEKLKGCTVKISAKAGSNGKLFGAVTSKEIAEALREQYGIELEKNRIVQSEPVKTYGSFEVKCKLGYEISGALKVMVIEG